jgi:hypothetical protein
MSEYVTQREKRPQNLVARAFLVVKQGDISSLSIMSVRPSIVRSVATQQ